MRRPPVAQLTNLKKSAIAIRVNPTPFTLRPGPSTFSLSYRYVYAVLTLDTLFIYDTQQESAIAVLGGLHDSGLTDVCWGDEGRVLCLSSSDGYVSIVAFEEGECVGRCEQDVDVSQRVLALRVRSWPTSGPVASKLPFLARNPEKIEFLTFSSRKTQNFRVKSHALNFTIPIHTLTRVSMRITNPVSGFQRISV
jgi:WD40 repeat protein